MQQMTPEEIKEMNKACKELTKKMMENGQLHDYSKRPTKAAK